MTVGQLVDTALSLVQSAVSLLLLPITYPFVLFADRLGWLREKVPLSNGNLQGKVVLITGASGGIGESLAHSFFQAGCKLILAARRRDELERVKNEVIRMKQPNTATIHVPAVMELDLSHSASIAAKGQEALDVYGGIDILINNAGILQSGNVLDTQVDVYRKIMEVNYFGTVGLTKVIGQDMKEKKKGGHIVFISSLAGKLALPHGSAYSASKHALQAFGDSLRSEVADDGIKVTMICPGYVKTDIAKNGLTGSGAISGKSNKNIDTGLSPDYVAERTLRAVKCEEKEVAISPLFPKVGLLTRALASGLFFFSMKLMGRAYNERDRAETTKKNKDS